MCMTFASAVEWRDQLQDYTDFRAAPVSLSLQVIVFPPKKYFENALGLLCHSWSV